MGIAVFNPSIFYARYPEFTSVNSGFLASLFVEAGFYLNNTDCSIVQDVPTRLALLNMITAHIAFMGGALNADGQPRPVGRVSAAGEGSVNATFEMNPQTPGTGPWYQQSQYGAAYWQATAKYRAMHYIPHVLRGR